MNYSVTLSRSDLGALVDCVFVAAPDKDDVTGRQSKKRDKAVCAGKDLLSNEEDK